MIDMFRMVVKMTVWPLMFVIVSQVRLVTGVSEVNAGLVEQANVDGQDVQE
jgi:hypothetical protein